MRRFSPLPLLAPPALAFAVTVAPWGLGCNKSPTGPEAKAPAAGEVLARVGDTAITVSEVQEELNKQSPYVRSRYTTPERKKEFVDNKVRFEVLYREAAARGFDKDPEVVRVAKQQAIQRMLMKQFEDPKWKPEGMPRADVEKYYEEHKAEFTRPEEVRVSQIVVKDEAKAKKVLAEAKAAKKDDQAAFEKLVEKHSEDASSKAMKGDLAFFDRNSPRLPKEIVEASFGIKDVNDVAGPIKTDAGFHILKLTQRKAGFTRTLAEAESQIRHIIYRDVRQKEMDRMLAELKQKANVQVFEENLAKVTVDTSEPPPGGAAPGGVPGMQPPGMPPTPPPAPTPAAAKAP